MVQDIWGLNADLKRRLATDVIDYVMIRSITSRLERKSNDKIKDRTNARKTVVDRIGR